MPADIGSPRIPIDPQLYYAAREGDINLLENHLRADNLTANGVGRLLFRQFNCLLGVTYSGDTALHIASYFGHVKVATRILDENISLLLRGNNKSETPLHCAAQAGSHEIVSKFIGVARGAQQTQNILQSEGILVLTELLRRRNQDGETALYQAVYNEHSAVVEDLIREDPHLAIIPDNNNVSPLYVAARGNSLEVVNSLIESFHGSMWPEACSGPDGQTALHAATFGQRGILQNILNWKRDLAKAKDDTGSTPLHYAASVNNINAVQLLLENDKAPAYIADSSGLFPVHVAAKLGHLEVMSQLFELCPDSDELLDTQGRNFLHIAVEKRQESIVQWARKNSRHYRSLNAKDYEGNTPMHLAVKARHLVIFALLLESKTLDLGIMNKKGLTPLDLAEAQRRHSINYLLSRDIIIYQALMDLRSRRGIRRRDHFLNEYKLEHDQKMEREAENFDNMAKSTSTVSVLIASASFAGIFTVSGIFTAHLGNQSSALNMAFKVFVLTVTYAFICSITATGLCMLATMTFIDPMDRRNSLLTSFRLVHMAIKGLIVAFAFGAYVILTPVSEWLAILICLTGSVRILINPVPRANIIILWALVRSIGWKELCGRGQGRYPLFFHWILYFRNTVYLWFIIVLIVMLCGLFNFSKHFLVLMVVIIVPLLLSILGNILSLFHHRSN